VAPDLRKQILDSLKIPPNDPQFGGRLFSLIARAQKEELSADARRLERVVTEEYDELSRRLDRSRLQDSLAVRNVLRTRRLAHLLINDQGEIQSDLVAQAIPLFEQHSYSLGPNRQADARRQSHILQVLTHLKDNKEALRLLKSISRPHAHRQAEQIIRHTLALPPHAEISDANARRAALAAWMCYLRQNVGSCFATAPAIIVHDEEPAQFLQDLNDLLGTGRLKRTFGGVEHTVPLSISWGAGDLKRNLVLQGEEAFEKSELWLSPGLMAAFEAAGLINQEEALKLRLEKVKLLIQRALPTGNAVLVSAEGMIRKVLMQQAGISEEELREYHHRPQAPLQANFMLQAAAKTTPVGKNQAIAQMLAAQELAENAFKILTDNALLKSWEFTLASFAETKATFSTWNLYSSLGLKPEEKGGIGFAMFETLKERLDQYNRKVQDLQAEYEQMFAHVKYLEGRLQRASTEKEIQWMKIEYQTQSNEFRLLEEMRDKAHHKAQRIAGMFDAIVEVFLELFPRYFQEVYDADMHEVAVGPYDDSPAGFRLLYKYGRLNTSQWTYIYNAQEFIDALHSFFNATEIEMSSRQEFTGLEQELSEIITAVSAQIRTVEFLETAFQRMAAFHKTPLIKDPLENLEKVDKKPWAYTSGGTMGSLVSNYFRLESAPTEVARWVENPMELLVFLVDTLKQIPPKIMEDFQKLKRQSLLIHSPTHAFLLKLKRGPFYEAWQSDAFTYTWVRDQMIVPMLRRVDELVLEPDMCEFLTEQLASSVPENFRFYFKKVFTGSFRGKLTSQEFRQQLMEGMQGERGLQLQGMPVLPLEEVDSYLYSTLPLLPVHKIREALHETFQDMQIPDVVRNEAPKLWDSVPDISLGTGYITSKQFREICKALIALTLLHTSSSLDYHEAVLQGARKAGYAVAAPILIADTNWMREDFGFVVSPGTGRVEFWRLDPYGAEGTPMTVWEPWLYGHRKDRTWGVYTRPYEYWR